MLTAIPGTYVEQCNWSLPVVRTQSTNTGAQPPQSSGEDQSKVAA